MEDSDSHEGTNAGFGRMAKSQHDSLWLWNFVPAAASPFEGIKDTDTYLRQFCL
jgi:hypothetical protein